MATATEAPSLNQAAQTTPTWKPNWFKVGAMALTAGTVAGLHQAFFAVNPSTVPADTREEPSTTENPQMVLGCSGWSFNERAACATLMNHLNSHSSDSTIYAFGALSDTRGITRENQMVLPQDSFPSPGYSGFCEVPIIGPDDLREPVMWGLDSSPESCPFMSIRYDATDPSNNQTETCALTLSQPSMNRQRPLLSGVVPANCAQGYLNPHKTQPETFHNTLRNLFQGNPVNERTLDGRAVVLKLKK